MQVSLTDKRLLQWYFDLFEESGEKLDKVPIHELLEFARFKQE